jgi:3D (Asp-Asp-Asp) domain-containing protein
MTTTELPAPTPKPLDPPPAPEPEIFEVTAYTAGPESTGKRRGDPNYGLTADGSHVADGIVACPKSYPFGTKFYVVELDRTFTCRDRGGAIKAGHLDIYVESLQTADDFGRQWLHVIVKPVHVD